MSDRKSPPRLRLINGGKSKPKQTEISILVTCGTDDTDHLRKALGEVSKKLRASQSIRGYAGEGLAWSITEVKPRKE